MLRDLHAFPTRRSSDLVNAGPLDHLMLSPASGSITAGGSQAYTAQGRARFAHLHCDQTVATSATICLKDSCAGAGWTASAAGTHTVSASDGGKAGTAAL